MTAKEGEVLAAIRKLCAASVNGHATHEQLMALVQGDYDDAFASLVNRRLVVAETLEIFKLA